MRHSYENVVSRIKLLELPLTSPSVIIDSRVSIVAFACDRE